MGYTLHGHVSVIELCRSHRCVVTSCRVSYARSVDKRAWCHMNLKRLVQCSSLSHAGRRLKVHLSYAEFGPLK